MSIQLVPLSRLVQSSPTHNIRLLSSSQCLSRRWKYHRQRDLVAPPQTSNTEMPERPRLQVMPRIPSVWSAGGIRPPKGTKELWRMMGEERVNNELILKQYGIIALAGGMLKHRHFEVMRLAIGRHCDSNKKKTFSFYRVDAPYKPITDHGKGKRMGGGKGSIDEYGTPVKAGKVVVEVGGLAEWAEVQPWLSTVAAQLPFHALAVHSDQLDKIREEEARLEQENTNPITFEWLVRNNIMNCQTKLSPYDRRWFGKFCYKDRDNNLMWKSVIGGYKRVPGQSN